MTGIYELALFVVSGVLLNLTPGADTFALFFLAFLPQFVDPAATEHFTAFLLLGAVFNMTGLESFCCVVVRPCGKARSRVARAPARAAPGRQRALRCAGRQARALDALRCLAGGFEPPSRWRACEACDVGAASGI
ncbi:MAG: hypothetical protein ACREYD_10315 [Casimicrobiaceae bacterium]